MASTILLRNISGTDDKRIVLSNSNFARPFTIPSGWTQLRIGIRLIMNNTGANLTSTPRIYVGLCSGSTNIILDATTTHFAGVYSDTASWVYSAGPPVSYGQMNLKPVKRVGSTTTAGASNITATNLYIQADATQAQRSVMFVDITKGSPDFTFNVFYRNNTTSGDVTLSKFLEQVVLASPTVTTHGAGTARTLAVSESDGTLNHVNIGWDRVSPTIEICDLALVKLA